MRGQPIIPSRLFGLTIRKPSQAIQEPAGSVVFRVRQVPSIDFPGNLAYLSQSGAAQHIGWKRSRGVHHLSWAKGVALRVGPGPSIRIDTVKPDFLEPEVINAALALILCEQGYVLVHGGGFALRNMAAIVMGPPGAGKSSLILAMARNGFEIISDEIFPLTADRGIVRCPGGNPVIRVSPELLSPQERGVVTSTRSGKALLDVRRVGLRSARGIRQVTCLFFLESRLDEIEPAFRLDRIPPSEALVRLIENAYARRVLTGAQQRRQLRVLGEVARANPSYSLSVRQGLENLDAAARGIGAFVSGGTDSGVRCPR